jgi:hypothetical protein
MTPIREKNRENSKKHTNFGKILEVILDKDLQKFKVKNPLHKLKSQKHL